MKKKKNLPLNFTEKNNSRISFIVSIGVLIVLFIVFHQLDYNMIRKPMLKAARAVEDRKQKEAEAEAAPHTTTATVIAVGDNLYHSSLMESGRFESGIWNYDHMYANVKNEIQQADIAIANQTTVFTNNHDQISSYPSFASPTEVGDSLVSAGFDVIGTASSNIDDFGYDYMAQTFEFWKGYPDITLIGTHETQEDADTVKIREVKGIKIAFLDYTYGTNNSGAGEGRDYMIDIFDKDKVASDIQKAKEASDCIILLAHWGTTDEAMPNEYQKEWAAFLMEQGVDVVIGSHPYILQPYGRLTDDSGHDMTIFYSLGNFVTGQERLSALLGGMAKFTIQKTTEGEEFSVKIINSQVEPTVMHYSASSGEYGVYMLKNYTDELASGHEVREIIGDEFTLANLQKKFQDIMSMNVKPSTNTTLLNVKFQDGVMVDKSSGNTIEDTWSTTAAQYWAQAGNGQGENE